MPKTRETNGHKPGTGEPVVAVLGGGPAGLTAAYAASQAGRRAVLVEAGSRVGGLARTEVRDGYRFDLGGHRFFTKNAQVEALWQQLLGPELMTRPRLSRIYWRGRFIDYPLSITDLVRKVGPLELVRSAASYANARFRPSREADNFEEWVTQRFGRRLFTLFFDSYTEKVWGVPTSEIRAEWAAQRIRDLSLGRAVRAALPGGPRSQPHSLIESFSYPRLGPGQMWEQMATEITRFGSEVRTGTAVTGLTVDGGRVSGVETTAGFIEANEVISSLALRDLPAMANPGAPQDVLAAASGLRYRDFLTVALVVRGDDLFPDNWIYVHEPRVKVGRIQNYRSWSPDMVPAGGHGCVGLEYFCFEGDRLWTSPDSELIELAVDELDRLGLAASERVERGHVVRVPRAYPIYDREYEQRLNIVRGWLDGIDGLQQIGRNGLHRYNNSDHSMLTALRAVENLHGADHDVWSVNADEVYLEEAGPAEQPYRLAPETPAMRAETEPAGIPEPAHEAA